MKLRWLWQRLQDHDFPLVNRGRTLVSHLVDEAEIAPGDLEKLRKQLARGGREHE